MLLRLKKQKIRFFCPVRMAVFGRKPESVGIGSAAFHGGVVPSEVKPSSGIAPPWKAALPDKKNFWLGTKTKLMVQRYAERFYQALLCSSTVIPGAAGKFCGIPIIVGAQVPCGVMKMRIHSGDPESRRPARDPGFRVSAKFYYSLKSPQT